MFFHFIQCNKSPTGALWFGELFHSNFETAKSSQAQMQTDIPKLMKTLDLNSFR